MGRPRSEAKREHRHWTNLTKDEEEAWDAAVEAAFPGSLKPQDAGIVREAMATWAKQQGVVWPKDAAKKPPPEPEKKVAPRSKKRA